MNSRFVAYYRASTDKQGRSKLGLEAQRNAVQGFLAGGRSELIAEFTEIESGKQSDRPALKLALATCRKQKARLVIAKLDRLSRSVAFIASLMEQGGVQFTAADMPEANETMLHMMAVFAQYERKAIGRRTTEALAAARRRGVKLGSPTPHKGAASAAESHKRRAVQHAANVIPIIREIQRSGAMTLRSIAKALNARGVGTARNGDWGPQAVANVLRRTDTTR